MKTPSLGTRIVAAGVGLVVGLSIGLDLLLYFALRSNQMAGVDRALDTQAAVVHAANRQATADLPGYLANLGIKARIRTPSGEQFTSEPAESEVDQRPPVTTRDITLDDGTVVTISASRVGVQQTLDRLVRLELILTPLIVLLAFLLLRLISEVALRPLEVIAAAARRTTEGRRGERLRPDDPDTRLGQMATAYDAMLDALEAAVADARAAQAKSESLLERDRQILETAQEAFVAMDEQGVIVEWNAEAERTFGWKRDQAVGRLVAETIIPQHLRHAHRAGLEHYLLHGTGSLLGRRAEYMGLHRDGHEFPVEITVWETRHAGYSTFNAFLRDVSARKEAEKTASQLAAIVESTDAAMLSTDLERTIQTWNRGAERMYGWTAAETIGRHLDLIVPSDQHHQVEASFAALARGEVQRIETVRRCKNGTLIEVALTISPIRDASGRIVGASSIARDITEERWMASQLDATLGALEAALDEARESEAASRRFLDDAAHQLRAPITSIRACAEALARGALPTERDRLLSAVVRETSRASRLMTGLLQMARLHQGRRLEPRPCDLVALCQEEAERIQWVAPQLDVAVSEETPANGEEVREAEVDPQAVAEILANLLDNARRHAKSRIDLIVGRHNGHVEVKVIDDGPGLPEGMASAAFDRFVSLDAKGGSGLGLPIARELARAHGGDLRYEDRVFVLELPVSVSTDGSSYSDGPVAER